MNPLRGTFWILGAAVGVFLLWRGYTWNEGRLDAERAEFKRVVQAKDSSLAVAQIEKAQSDSALANQIPIYISAQG